MNKSLAEKLAEIVSISQSFSSFYDNVAVNIGIIEAETFVRMEFGNLKAYYDWAFNKEKNSSESGKLQYALILHPEMVHLREETKIIRKKLSKVLFEYNELVFTIVPNLKAIYMTRLGMFEVELLNIKNENRRIRRKIQLIQMHLNRGNKPDLESIEKQMEEEMAEWNKEIKEKKKALETSREFLKTLMNENDNKRFKHSYRTLVKRLHPDLNPHQSEKEKSLWLRTQRAYERGDLDEIELLLILADSSGSDDFSPDMGGIEGWKQLRNKLESKLWETENKIKGIKSEFPYTMIDILFDEESIKEINRKRKLEIKDELAIQQFISSRLNRLEKAVKSE